MNIRLIALLASFAGNAHAFITQQNVAHRPSLRGLVAPPLDMTSSDDVDTSHIQTGRVQWFDKKKGYGFIIPDEGGEDVFAHQGHIKMDGFRFLTPKETVHFKVAYNENRDGNKIYATEIYKAGSIEDMAAMSHELEEAVHEVTLLEADAFGVAMDADQVAESIDAAQHDESTMTIKSAQQIAEVEAQAKEEVEDIAAHALPIMAVEQIASKLEEEKKKAEANEKAKVAASTADKTHPDPFHHLKSMFGI